MQSDPKGRRSNASWLMIDETGRTQNTTSSTLMTNHIQCKARGQIISCVRWVHILIDGFASDRLQETSPH